MKKSRSKRSHITKEDPIQRVTEISKRFLWDKALPLTKKIAKWLCIIAFAIILLCLSPFIILALISYASKPFNDRDMDTLISNYNKYEHPVASERVRDILSSLSSPVGNGDAYGPCHLTILDVRKTSSENTEEEILKSYQNFDLTNVTKGLPLDKENFYEHFTVSFFNPEFDSEKEKIPDETLERHFRNNFLDWRFPESTDSLENTTRLQRNDSSHIYYLIDLTITTEMKGLDGRCIRS